MKRTFKSNRYLASGSKSAYFPQHIIIPIPKLRKIFLEMLIVQIWVRASVTSPVKWE